MKRLVLMSVYALIIVFGAGFAGAQNWAPGLPMAPLPPPGMPMPMGPGLPGPGFGQPFCGPMPCGPGIDGSGGGMLGLQLNSDVGFLKISTQGLPVFTMYTEKVDVKLEGLWLGGSGRVAVSDGLRVRGEGRYFIPTKENASETVSNFGQFAEAHRNFSAKHSWYILDGSAGLDVAAGLSVLGGLRYEYFGAHLSKPPAVPTFSDPSDEGDFKIGSIKPYIGFEFAWTSCDTGLLIRAIGSPWINCNYRLGMTYQTAFPLHASMHGDSTYATFSEIVVQVGKRLTDKLSVGAFVSVNSMSFHGESTLQATQQDPVLTTASEKFDADFNRRYFTVGGNAALSFRSFL